MRNAVVVLLLVAMATPAHAEAWYEGRYGKNRLLHVSIAVGGSILNAATLKLDEVLVVDTCRWCDPTALDVAARDAFRWHDASTANAISNVTVAATPVYAVALVLAGTYADPSTAAIIDDLTPMLETLTITLWVARITKLAVGRQRPYAHFIGPMSETQDNVSFPSGHTTTAFSLAISGAMVAHFRDYRSEMPLWIGGTLLAATTGYLRIAADKHYLTDVLTGAALGTAAGLTVPLLMKRDVAVTPMRDGVAVVGVW